MAVDLPSLPMVSRDRRPSLEWRLDGGGSVSSVVVDSPYDPYVLGYGLGGNDMALVVEVAAAEGEMPVTQAIDSSTGETIGQFPGVYGPLPSEKPDVATVIFGDDGTVGSYDLARRAAAGPRVDPGFEIQAVYSDDDRVVVTGVPGPSGVPTRLQGVDVDTGQLVGPTIDGGDEFEIWSVALTPDALYTSDTTMNGEISVDTPRPSHGRRRRRTGRQLPQRHRRRRDRHRQHSGRADTST